MTAEQPSPTWRFEVAKDAIARIDQMRDDLIKRMLTWLMVGNGGGLALMASLLASRETRPEIRGELVLSAWSFAAGVAAAFIFGFFVTEMMIRASGAGAAIAGGKDATQGDLEALSNLEQKQVRELGVSALAAAFLFVGGVVNALLAAG